MPWVPEASGGPREAPGRPTEVWGGFPGAPGPPWGRVKNVKANIFCRAPISGPEQACRRSNRDRAGPFSRSLHDASGRFSVWEPEHKNTRYSMLRNTASGLEIRLPGRILAGLLHGKHRNRPSGRPSAGRRADFGAFPVAVRPKSGPEVRFPAQKHYCVT